MRFSGVGRDGAPYGYSRAILLYLIVGVISSGEQAIYVSAEAIARFYGFGKESTIVRDHLPRILRCVFSTIKLIRFGREREYSPLQIFKTTRVCMRTKTAVVTLSDRFYQSICNGPRLAECVVKALVKSNQLAALDLYIWYMWQLHDGPAESIPVRGLESPFRTIRFTDHEYVWRDRIVKLHAHIKKHWPECPFSISPDGRHIRCNLMHARSSVTHGIGMGSESSEPGQPSPDLAMPAESYRPVRSTMTAVGDERRIDPPVPASTRVDRGTQPANGIRNATRRPARRMRFLTLARTSKIARFILPQRPDADAGSPSDTHDANQNRGPPR